MGQRDKDGKRLKWTRAEKRMVKALKAQGLQPEKSVLALRGRARELGKYPAVPSSFDQRPNQPFHLAYPAYPAYPVHPVYQTEQCYPIPPFHPVFYPIADDEGPSSDSRAWAQATPTVNSVVVVPGHDEKGGNQMVWGDPFSDAAITPDLPNQDKAPSPKGTEKTNDCDVERSSDDISNAESEGFDPEGDYEASESDDMEMVDPVEAEIDEIIALDALDLEKEEDDTDQLLQELYMEYRPDFPLATLTMELVFEVGRHLTKKIWLSF